MNADLKAVTYDQAIENFTQAQLEILDELIADEKQNCLRLLQTREMMGKQFAYFLQAD